MSSSPEQHASEFLTAGGAMLARWLDGLTPDQLAKFDTLLAAGGVPGADVLLAPTGPVVSLYVQDPAGQRHKLVTATAPAMPPVH